MAQRVLVPIELPPAPAEIPEVRWFGRLLHECEESLAGPDPAGVQAAAGGLFAMAGLAAQPWSLARTQWSMFSMMLEQWTSLQAYWLRTWARAPK